MLCKHCDTRLEDDARFCHVCGKPASLPATAPAQAPAAVRNYVFSDAPMTGPVCPSCARANPQGARFCVFCAAALAGGSAPAGQLLQPAYGGGASAYTVVVPTFQLANHSHLLLRAVWFVLIGWWLGLLWTIGAWLFNLTLIGIPVGLMMLNRIPTIMTLQPRATARILVGAGGPIVLQPTEHPLPLRAIWFVLVGWWASLVWMLTAWALSATVLLLPIGFWMFNRVPTITTLAAEK